MTELLAVDLTPESGEATSTRAVASLIQKNEPPAAL